MPPKAIRRLEIAIYAWAVLVAVGLYLQFATVVFDDPYITYRYAQQIAAGQGFVYNPDWRVLSTTAPFYALILTPAAWLQLDLPLISNAISCLSIGAAAVALWRLARPEQYPVAALAAATTYPLIALLVATLGIESTFVVALGLWTLVYWVDGRYHIAAILLGIATLTRADAVLVGVICGLIALQRAIQATPRFAPLTIFGQLPWRAVGTYLLVLLPWIGFSLYYFGSPIPATLSAKQQQLNIAGSNIFIRGLSIYIGYYLEVWAYRGIAVIAGLGLIGLSWRYRWAWVVVGWGALYATAYTLLQVSTYFWYFIAVLPAITFAYAIGVQVLYDGLSNYLPTRMACIVSLGVILSIHVGQVQTLIVATELSDPRAIPYRATGEWLAQETPSDASVGALEVGIIGFYAQRPMIDFAGLIQPAVAQRFAQGENFDQAAIWSVQTYTPDYIVLLRNQLPLLEQMVTTQPNCRLVHTIEQLSELRPLDIYQCQWEK